MKRHALVAGLSVIAFVACLSEAGASTVSVGDWTSLFRGVSETTATVSGVTAGVADSSVAYVVRIDLQAPGIGFTTTPLASGGAPGTTFETQAQTTSQFLQSSGAQVAINANFFAPCGCSTTVSSQKWLEGLAISNGTLVSPDDPDFVDLLLTKTNEASIVSGGTTDLADVYNAVAGNVLLVDGGVNIAPTDSNAFNNDNPRSVAGLSKNGQDLYLVAIDGRQPGYSTGASLVETADLLTELGAWTAVNLDGGGSTALAVEGPGGVAELLNRPSSAGGAERYNGNNFAVFADPVPEPSTWTLLAAGFVGLGIVALRRRGLGAAA